MNRPQVVVIMAALMVSACRDRAPTFATLVAAVETVSVPDVPDDPAIWIHPSDPARSTVVVTNKVEQPAGALIVFDLQGKILQTVGNLDRPNNVDIEQNILLEGRRLDIAVVAERRAHAIRLYSIDPETRLLSEMARLPVLAGEEGEFAEPMGIAIYKRTNDAVFVIIGRKAGPVEGYLWQYRLRSGPAIELVRRFGRYSGEGEIEAIAVDDALGYVYYADEAAGIRKYDADPEAADHELAFFGQSGYRGDREGIAIYATDERKGFVVSTDQIEGSSRYLLYRREGTKSNAHDHSEIVAILEGPADATDGIEVVSTPLSPTWPRGLFVAMNSGHRNFLFFPWPQH